MQKANARVVGVEGGDEQSGVGPDGKGSGKSGVGVADEVVVGVDCD
jgi:hypothetical protein